MVPNLGFVIIRYKVYAFYSSACSCLLLLLLLLSVPGVSQPFRLPKHPTPITSPACKSIRVLLNLVNESPQEKYHEKNLSTFTRLFLVTVAR